MTRAEPRTSAHGKSLLKNCVKSAGKYDTANNDAWFCYRAEFKRECVLNVGNVCLFAFVAELQRGPYAPEETKYGSSQW